jgi:helicase required for RNAi-mediated heterochromatin assembly 1
VDVADDCAGGIHPDELDDNSSTILSGLSEAKIVEIIPEDRSKINVEADASKRECEKDYDSEESVNDEQLRLADIGGKENDDGEEVDDEANPMHEFFVSKESNLHSSLESLKLWSWSLSPSDRLKLANKFLDGMCVTLASLQRAIDDDISQSRQALAEASAMALKNAKVVGATVVGASRRLQALRAAEPFAVVVEEACEVMEPTLVSVLAVKSLKKLELIGDHRQLPAFVQLCWYNLEVTVPSIKVSLFERLVSGKVSQRYGTIRMKVSRHAEINSAETVASSILDEQRRMCESISDISRQHYQDLVDIIDHEKTKTQRVGDRIVSQRALQKFEQERQLWQSQGRLIPGVTSNIFFWNIKNNKESRPIAGLSACNQSEAEAAVALSNYLNTCGVPEECVTILTPYKGQKTLILKLMRKLKQRNRNYCEPATMVSTVDRYQGDENDIIILSLVRTRPGNRFVALLNRFIVAVSRARLGFFIVGSVDAVVKGADWREVPSHWCNFVEELSK